MRNDYHLTDGSPRYGARIPGAETPAHLISRGTRIEEVAEAGARLGLDDLAAAIDRRLASSWSDAPDPLVEGLRKDYPEELTAARALVKLHLGSQRQWRLKAQAVRDQQLTGLMARRRSSGNARRILALRVLLMVALIAMPVYVVATDREDLLKLVLTGVACIVVALASGHFITAQARVPVMPNIRSAWLAELRDDVINATLVAILENKGVELAPTTSAAGLRGWRSIHAASLAVAALHA